MAAAESLESIANSIVSLHMRRRKRRLESEHHAEMVKKLGSVNRLEHQLQESEFRALRQEINPYFCSMPLTQLQRLFLKVTAVLKTWYMPSQTFSGSALETPSQHNVFARGNKVS